MQSWLLRGVLTVALAAAGVLTYAAASERWWPACSRGEFDSAACLRVQSHELDYLVPTAPWEPIGRAAEYGGASLLALALAALVAPFVLRPGVPHGGWRTFALVVAIVPATALVVLGLVTLRAGLTGEPTPGSLELAPVFLVWAVAWPGALTVFACVAPGRTHRSGAVLLAGVLGLSTPVPVVLVLGPIAAGYLAHDAVPWSEATAAPLLIVAAVAVWPATVPVRARRSRQPVVTTAAT